MNVEALYCEDGEFRFDNGWHLNVLIAAGIGIVFSSTLPGLTSLMPTRWGVYGWVFGVPIAGGIYYALRSFRLAKPYPA